jgi:hypothetical protein
LKLQRFSLSQISEYLPDPQPFAGLSAGSSGAGEFLIGGNPCAQLNSSLRSDPYSSMPAFQLLAGGFGKAII